MFRPFKRYSSINARCFGDTGVRGLRYFTRRSAPPPQRPVLSDRAVPRGGAGALGRRLQSWEENGASLRAPFAPSPG
jgi:hypothetical protein